MDRVDEEGVLTTGYQNYEQEKEDEINMFVGAGIEDRFEFSSSKKPREYQTWRVPTFNQGK